MGVLDQGDQKVQTSSYNTSARDVLYTMINTINITVCYICKFLGVNPKNFHHKEKKQLFPFLLFCICMR